MVSATREAVRERIADEVAMAMEMASRGDDEDPYDYTDRILRLLEGEERESFYVEAEGPPGEWTLLSGGPYPTRDHAVRAADHHAGLTGDNTRIPHDSEPNRADTPDTEDPR